ncbi:MAG: hypothetical protein N2578_04965 [Bdellovibrionaceae bacterium]|nr:hypothetical protein [Pseudobdellovibrionaceae bacterium]
MTLFLVLVLSESPLAQPSALEVDVASDEKIEILLKSAELFISGIEGERLKVSSPHAVWLSSLKWKRSGGRLTLQDEASPTAPNVDSAAGNSRVRVEVFVPRRNTLVKLSDGRAVLRNLSAETTVNLLDGKISLERLNALTRLQVLKGDIHIVGGAHRLEIEQGEGTLTLEGFAGDARLSTLSVKISASKLRGNNSVEMYTGSLQCNDCSGQLKIEGARPQVSLGKWSGVLEGRFREGQMSADLEPGTNADLSGGATRFNLRLAKGGAWRIDARSQLADISVQPPLRAIRQQGDTVVLYRSEGSENPIRLTVRSKDGPIVLR